MSLIALVFSVAVAATSTTWAARDLLASDGIVSVTSTDIHSRSRQLTDAGDKFDFPTGTGSVVVDETIKVKAGETFDGEMKVYRMANEDSKDPIMRVRRGATLKNMIIDGRPGNGINFFGNNEVENVWFLNVKGGKAFRIVHNAADFEEEGIYLKLNKCGVKNAYIAFSVNAGGMRVDLTDFRIDNSQRALFFCQKCKFPFNIEPTTVQFHDSVFRYPDVDAPNANATIVEADAGDPTLITARGKPDLAILNLRAPGLAMENVFGRPVCTLGHPGMCETNGFTVDF